MKITAPTLKPIPIGQPMPLTVDDLARLHEGNRSTSSIQKLRASHHKIARLAAYGFNNKAIAAHTGYTRERVGQLLGSPAMKELVAVYSEKVIEQEKEDLDAYLALKTSNMVAAERHIADHIAELDEAGELLPVKTALAISADGADRTGYGKRQTNMNVNVDFAAMLEKAIKRSGKQIEGSVMASSVAVRKQTSPLALVPPRPLVTRRA